MKRVTKALLAFVLISALRCAPAYGQDEVDMTIADTTPVLLVISSRESGVLTEIPLPDRRFDHVFVHSFHLTPVVERFRIVTTVDGSLVMHLFELEYESPGVGMPSDAENGYHLVDGKFLLTMDRDLVVIPLMVSIVDGHGVIAGGSFHPFTEWAPKETMLFLAVRPVSD